MHVNEEALILHYYGEGDDPAVESHLEGCPTCRLEFEKLRRVLSMVDEQPVPDPSPGFERQMWARIQPMLEQHPSDVMLLDWHLPGMSGIEYLKLLRGTEHGRSLAIFIYSGVEDQTGIREALSSGADGFIPKPITLEKVEREFKKLRIL